MNLSETKYLVDEVGQVLLDAADYIEKHGWCQGNYCDPLGRVCALGALNIVSCGIPNHTEGIAINAAIRLMWNLRITQWNDHPERTKEEVIAALRKVALG